MCQSRQDCTQAESGTVGFEPSSVWFQTFALTHMLIICKLYYPDDLQRGPLTEAASSATLWTAAQTVKNLPAMRETWVRSLGRESPRGGHGNPLQYSFLENPTDRGAWWAAVHRIAKNRTRLSGLTFFGAPIRVTGKGYGNTQCCVTFSNNHFLKPSLWFLAKHFPGFEDSYLASFQLL